MNAIAFLFELTTAHWLVDMSHRRTFGPLAMSRRHPLLFSRLNGG